MRIGINVSFLSRPTTGIGQVTRACLVGFARHPQFSKHEWFLYTDGELAEEFRVPLPQANVTWRPVRTWWRRQDIPHQYLFESHSLVRAVTKDRLDAFLSLYQAGTVLPSSLRHVMLVHDLIPLLFPEYLHKLTSRFQYGQVLKALSQTTHLLTPSHATKSDLEKLLPIPASKVTPLPLGIDGRFGERVGEEALQDVLGRYGLAPGYLYHGGGLEVRKNTRVVLYAYAELLEEGWAPLPPLVISGKIHAEDNPLATPVRALIRELRLEERVKLLGLVPDDDLPALYQAASLFLFPSLYEGFGLPVLEAFASGVPVIATEAGALQELTRDGAALVLPLGDESVPAMKEAIKRVVTDHAFAEDLRQRGKERAGEYSWEAFANGVMRSLLQ